VITVVAIIIGAGSDSAGAGLATWAILAFIGGMVWLATNVCASCQDKKDPERQATVEAQNANVQAQETAEAEGTPEVEATEEPTPTAWVNGTEVAFSGKVGPDCYEKLIVKGSVRISSGYAYRVEPECFANRSEYDLDVYRPEEELEKWEDGKYSDTCDCGKKSSYGEYDADPTPEPTEED